MTELEKPGAGIPKIERVFLNAGIKTMSVFMSDRRALKFFKNEARMLTDIWNNGGSYDAFKPILISRMIGIEDSSRNWSVAMVLEHLVIVNKELKVGIDSLSKGKVPSDDVDTALYKPKYDLDEKIHDVFVATNNDYVETVESNLDTNEKLPLNPTCEHPWFGELNAHQWGILAAIHMRIHRRQVLRIIAMLTS